MPPNSTFLPPQSTIMVKDEEGSNIIPSHPYLTKPILYIGGVLEKVSNQEIVEGLIECLRLR